jgi:hypothetical protein
MMKRPTVTKAQIERVLKAAKASGYQNVKVEIGGLTLSCSQGENSGEKAAAKVVKIQRMI